MKTKIEKTLLQAEVSGFGHDDDGDFFFFSMNRGTLAVGTELRPTEWLFSYSQFLTFIQ